MLGFHSMKPQLFLKIQGDIKMEIVKLLRVNAETSEPNAVLINDQGEEYPVFLESLTNTVYFDLLLESGYVFVGLPYNFKKDGMRIMDLKVEDYDPTPAELEGMYNSIGAPESYDKLKASISIEEVVSIPTPPTKYTISTREEFLDYLDTVSDIKLEDDFKPINYFVAPSARFTIMEYLSEKYSDYIQIMNSRRNMSLQKFSMLFNWLKNFGLNDNADEMDVLDAYFAWGMDGLNEPIIAKRREQRPNALTGNTKALVQGYRKTQGFIDSAGNMLTPPDSDNVRWELPSNSPTYVTDIAHSIPIGDTVVQEYRCKITTVVTVMEGPNFNIYYNADCALVVANVATSLQVKSPVESTNVPLSLALPKNRNKLLDHLYMEALSRMLYEKRRSNIDVSSYRALTMSGANPQSALNYVSTYDGMDKDTQEKDNIIVRDYDIVSFLNGDTIDESVREYLQGIIDGTVNIDSVAAAKRSEAHVNTTNTFNEIYALHNVMGIELSKIYEEFSKIDDNSDYIVFEGSGIKHTMDVRKMKYAMNGYLNDINAYNIKNTENCTAFVFVTNIAREVGSEDCRRHVGIEFYMVLKRPKVTELLDKLEAKYREKVAYRISSVNERAKMEKLCSMFALSRYFEIALNGKMTWPESLGGDVENIPFEETQAYTSTLVRKIENLTAFCSYTIQGTTARDLGFNLYCVNAYITPEYVIPRKGYTIHEASFYALWNNYASSSPQIYNQLIDIRALPKNFQAWSIRYEDEQFVSRGLFEQNNDSLTYYNMQSSKEQDSWPCNLEFDSVQHPIEYMFPGIERPEKERVTLGTPRNGAPVVRIGVHRELTLDDMKFALMPSIIDNTTDQYIRQFTGFNAEAFDICTDLLSKIPYTDNCPFIVNESSETVYIATQKRTINFRQLTEVMSEFNIVHVYDRIYLFRSQDGALWEVRI